MKKYILLFLAFLGLVLASCTDKNNNADELEPNGLKNEVTILVPNGTPYIGLGGLLDEENISITAVNGADNLKSGLVSESYDIIVAPVNLGTQLYSKGNSKYKRTKCIYFIRFGKG